MKLEDIQTETHVQALARSIRNAKWLRAEHAALVRLAYAQAVALDSVYWEDCAPTELQKKSAAYVATLAELGISAKAGVGVGSVRPKGTKATEADASPRLLSLADFQDKAVNGG